MKKAFDDSVIEYSICVVGAGGIGTLLLAYLSRLFINQFDGYGNTFVRMAIIDGDHYEEKNLARQFFAATSVGRNKAAAQIDKFMAMFPNSYAIQSNNVYAVEEYITEENIETILPPPENLIIFSCVDNHACRYLLSKYTEKFKRNNVVLITGGNETYDGSVHIQGQYRGVPIGEPIEKRHPEITTDKTDDRSALSCQELYNMPSGDQLLVANAGAAYFMYAAFMAMLKDPTKVANVQDIFFDAAALECRVIRPKIVIGNKPDSAQANDVTPAKDAIPAPETVVA